MSFVVDHVFVFCRPAAPEAARLEAAGLRAGRQRRHAGQGTANTCFFFADVMLELIWLADAAEARAPNARPLGLAERAAWRANGACPFGVCLRGPRDEALPFASFDHAPDYAPPGRPLRIAELSRDAAMPMLFAFDFAWDPPATGHPLRARPLQQCTLHVPQLAPTSPLHALAVPKLAFATAAEPLLELQLGGEPASRTLDLRPELPLSLRW